MFQKPGSESVNLVLLHLIQMWQFLINYVAKGTVSVISGDFTCKVYNAWFITPLKPLASSQILY